MAKKIFSVLSMLIITSLVAGIPAVYAQTAPADFTSEPDKTMAAAHESFVKKDMNKAAEKNGMEGTEGAFCCCSFWLAECLAYQGRLERARKIFQRVLGTGNDLGIFSEEYDPQAREMLGNFPQALTHLSLIAAAVAIEKAGG